MEKMAVFKIVFWAGLGCGVILVVGGVVGKELLEGFSSSSDQFSAALYEPLPLAPQEIQVENDSVVPESKVNSNFNKITGEQTQTVSSSAVNVVATVPSLQTSAPASVAPSPSPLSLPQPSQPAMPPLPATPAPAPTLEPLLQSQTEISALLPAQLETSAPAPETNALKNIVINEIQTAGATVKDEFIELYNPNNVDVDLQGFVLKKKTSGGKESNLISKSTFSGTIPALGFFVIVPQQNDDGTENYMGPAIPNARYSGATFSLANNNTVLLYNAGGVLVDKVGFGEAQDYEMVPAPNPVTGQSIARKQSGLDTDNNNNDFVVTSATPSL